MAIILSQITIGDHRIMVVDSAPNVGSGLSAPIGSMLIVEGQDAVWLKIGSNNTDWKISTVDKDALYQRLDDIESAANAEESRALAAESALQDAIDAEALVRQNAVLDLQGQISAIDAVNDQDLLNEVSRAQAAEALLQSNIDAEASTRESADQGLDSRISTLEQATQGGLAQEILDRQAADVLLQSNIDAEALARQGADDELDGRLEVVEANLSQEILDRQSGDTSTLASAQVYTDQKVADLVNSAPEVLNTLKELSDALGGDENFAVTVAGQIGAVDDRVDQEISDRQAADNVLQSAIDDEEVRALAAEAALQSDIDSEESSRIAADQQLQSDIDAEEARALLAESGLQSQITQEIADRVSDVSAEETRALAAEAVLQAAIDQSNLDLDNLDGYAQDVRSDLDQEILDRESGDSALDARIDVLEADPVTKTYVDAADSSLQSQITQEIQDRQSGDSSTLSSAQSYTDQKVADLVNSAPAVLDTLKELSDALGGDENFAATIAGQIGSVDDKVDQEIADRAAEDLTLVKLDGSRDMTGNLSMGTVVVGGGGSGVTGVINGNAYEFAGLHFETTPTINFYDQNGTILGTAEINPDTGNPWLVSTGPQLMMAMPYIQVMPGLGIKLVISFGSLPLPGIDTIIAGASFEGGGGGSASYNKIVNLANGVDAHDAVNKGQLDALDLLKLNKAGDTMSGDLDMGSNEIVSVDKLGLGSAAPETKFHLEENNVKFNISARSVSTSGAVNAIIASIEPGSDSVELFKVMVTGIDSSSKDSVAYERTVRIKNVGGTLGLGAIQSDYTSEDISMVEANCTFIVNASNVDVRVTGIDSKDITWKCVINRMR